MNTRQKRYNMKYVILCCTVAAFGGLLMGYDSSIISGAIEPLSEYFKLTPAETGWAVSNILLGSWDVKSLSPSPRYCLPFRSLAPPLPTISRCSSFSA